LGKFDFIFEIKDRASKINQAAYENYIPKLTKLHTNLQFVQGIQSIVQAKQKYESLDEQSEIIFVRMISVSRLSAHSNHFSSISFQSTYK